MNLPYETATSGERAVTEIQKILRSFGCGKFGHMMDYDKGELLMQFEYRGMPVTVRASISGYAAAWLKAHPMKIYLNPERKLKREREAKRIAQTAVYSILRDWIKGQIAAVETGVLSFEGAFLGQILLPSGRTVLEEAKSKNLLPAPKDEKVVQLKGPT